MAWGGQCRRGSNRRKRSGRRRGSETWIGGMGRDPSDERLNELLETGVRDRSDETKVMSFRDEMRVNEREREASGNILINR